MSDGMGREFTYLSSHATNRYFIPNWGYELYRLVSYIHGRISWSVWIIDSNPCGGRRVVEISSNRPPLKVLNYCTLDGSGG